MKNNHKTKGPLKKNIEKLQKKAANLEAEKSQNKQKKNELNESKDQFRILFEATFEGIVIHDQGRILDANQTFAQMFGYRLNEIKGMNVVELAAPGWKETVKDHAQKGREEPYQAMGLRKDGSVFPGELRGRKIRYQGKDVRLTAVADLTTQKEAEAAKEKTLHDLGERNKELKLLYEVSRLSSKADLSLEEFLQKSADLIPPAWRYPEITCAQITIDNQKYKTKIFKKSQWDQCEDIRVNGKKLGTVEVYYLEEKPELDEGPFLKEERNLIRTLSSLLSRIIERKKTDKALEESEKLYSSVVENSNDAIIIHHDGIIRFVNEAASRFIGVPKNEFLGKKMTDFVHPDDREIVLDRFKQRREGKDVKSIYEVSLVKKDGSSFPAEINVSLIHYQGRPAGLVFLRDITERKFTEEALRERKELLSHVFESMQEGVLVLNSDFRYTYWNKSMEQTSQVQKEDVLGQIPWKKFPFLKGNIEQAMKKAMEGEASRGLDLKYTLANGKEGWTTESYFPLKDAEENIIGVVGLIEEITERKQMEQELRESESKFRDIFENAGEGITYTSLGGKVIEVNKAFENILGIPSKKITGKNILSLTKELLTLKNATKILPLVKNILKGKEVAPFEARYKDKTLLVSSTYNPKSKRIIGLIRDITETKKKEEQIKKSLHEKEILLKEIHHRVKNNMQVISSLINIQARRLKDHKIREMFRATRNRVMSMALVHERLYRAEDLARIDFSKYIERVAVHLMSYYRDLSQNIDLKKDLDDIFLDVTKAVPLGLITNELLTNSLKHAFPKSKKGEIKIEIKQKKNMCLLTIRDNGKGLPQDLDFKKAESMGLDLVTSLVKQINGKIELYRDKGTCFEITFEN
ncbi:MAG: PAS domain S-box protein [Candidatus Aminicenantes bacterium]|nr:PAS domain S-box protein [Candidatus Aminicenantes bacterium]